MGAEVLMRERFKGGGTADLERLEGLLMQQWLFKTRLCIETCRTLV